MKIINFIKSNNEYFQDFISRSTFHSNAIEGNTLSYAETYAIIWNDNSFKITAQPREWYEAINHKYALSFVLDCVLNEEELSEKLIRKIGIFINKNIKEIDGYRKVNVFIKGAEHTPPLANMVSQNMMYFVNNYNTTTYNNIYEKIAYNHIEFERIHPFEDGNGRTGRLLINFELLKNDIPPIVILKDDRIKYFDMIANKDVNQLAHFIKELSNKELETINQYKEIKIEKSIEFNELER